MTERGLGESDTLISGRMSHEQMVETVFVDDGEDNNFLYTGERLLNVQCDTCESNLSIFDNRHGRS